MKVFRLRVSIMDIPKLYRIIEVSENCTFEELHNEIFNAFDRFDEHLYTFFITRKDTGSTRNIYDAPQITHSYNVEDVMGFEKEKKDAAMTRMSDAGLNEKDIFHYLFDFGDDWWHRIRVEKIDETLSKKKYIKLVKSVGDAPQQYPDDDEDYDEDEDE